MPDREMSLIDDLMELVIDGENEVHNEQAIRTRLEALIAERDALKSLLRHARPFLPIGERLAMPTHEIAFRELLTAIDAAIEQERK